MYNFKSKIKPFSYFVEHNKIIFLNSDQNYTIIHFNDGSSVRKAKTLLRFEKFLLYAPSFLRINRGTIVNMNYINSYEPVENLVFLESKRTFTISRRRVKNILPKILQNEKIKILD